ncbi:hypothetical protein KJ359_012574 [Pestalotiopsis sp. 9143b]|nr:hypothetical protein KJ359_001050 [Pestalotiopsis sp. 9143b]KAI4591771.1 hypothetical protein KJ359_012574 [Pestalotiopsis sp. 9143b]
MSKVLLITGATGKQGGAVVDALLQLKTTTPFTILAVTRNASSDSAKKLAQKSPAIKIVQGDLDDCAALFDEAKRVEPRPVWGVYSVQISMGKGVTTEGEVAQGKALIDEAMRRGVEYFVYSGVERGGDERSWDNPTPIPHFQTKHQIENYLRDATAKEGGSAGTMSWTVLRPVAFMDNLAPGMPTKVFMAAMNNWLQGKSTQWIATKDIGIFAAKAFQNPEKWHNRAIGLAGDELTLQQMSGVFERATGSPLPMTYSFLGSVLTYMVTELKLMIGWFADEGYRADIRERRAEHPQMLTMEQWLKEESGFTTI